MAMTRPERPLLDEDRKAHVEEPPSTDEARALGIASLIAQVQTMIEESGNAGGFDAATWVARWLDGPLPAPCGQRPMELMVTPDGRTLVHNVVARMRSGAYS